MNPSGAVMEGMNPFWFLVLIITTFAAPGFLVLTIVAGIVWCIVRSRPCQIIFFALLACTIFAGMVYVAAILMIGSSWP
jgi:hypothetical protein